MFLGSPPVCVSPVFATWRRWFERASWHLVETKPGSPATDGDPGRE